MGGVVKPRTAETSKTFIMRKKKKIREILFTCSCLKSSFPEQMLRRGFLFKKPVRKWEVVKGCMPGKGAICGEVPASPSLRLWNIHSTTECASPRGEKTDFCTPAPSVVGYWLHQGALKFSESMGQGGSTLMGLLKRVARVALRSRARSEAKGENSGPIKGYKGIRSIIFTICYQPGQLRVPIIL